MTSRGSDRHAAKCFCQPVFTLVALSVLADFFVPREAKKFAHLAGGDFAAAVPGPTFTCRIQGWAVARDVLKDTLRRSRILTERAHCVGPNFCVSRRASSNANLAVCDIRAVGEIYCLSNRDRGAWARLCNTPRRSTVGTSGASGVMSHLRVAIKARQWTRLAVENR